MYFSSPYFHQSVYPHPMLFSVIHPNTLSDDKVVSNKQNLCNQLSTSKRSIPYHTVETDDAYKLLLDLPGVKASDITVDVEKSNILKVKAVRKIQNEEQVTLEQKFFVDKKIANTTGAKSVLENGVLTIEMTKAKQSEPVIVDVKAADISEEDFKQSDRFHWTLDLPGVKISDIKVKYHDDHVSILATRKRSENIVKIMKKVFVSEEKFNVEKLKAYLVDGVLTVTAPPATQKNKKTNDDEVETKSTNIPVSLPDTKTSTDNTDDVVNPFDDSVVVNH